MKLKSVIFCLVASFCLGLVFSTMVKAQRRDYLTEAEVELVREAQEIDRRVEVLIKAIDRRFAVIKNQTNVKESEKWGELPKGTRLELFIDIQKILQKGIDDIDDVAERGPDSKLFPKAVRKLAGACQDYLPQFKNFLDSVNDERERGTILTSTDLCSAILESIQKLPKQEEKSTEEKRKKKNE